MTQKSSKQSTVALEAETDTAEKQGCWGKLGEIGQGSRLQSLSLGSSLETADASILYKEPHNSQSVSSSTKMNY